MNLKRGDLLTILTLCELSEAIKTRLHINEEAAHHFAMTVLDLFGFDDRIIDNMLSQKERKLFYLLESKGLLSTHREELFLYNGKAWRIHYWRLEKPFIHRLLTKSSLTKPHVSSQDPSAQEQQTLYAALPNELWGSRKNPIT